MKKISDWWRFVLLTVVLAPNLLFAQNASSLMGEWRLLEFQSMDDTQGVTKPRVGAVYTMRLGENSQAVFGLDCNRGNGTWSFKPASDESGEISITMMATTRVKCPAPNLDEQFSKHVPYIRSYLLQGDRLTLSLMADGGIYVWERIKNEVPKDTHKEPRNWEVTKTVALHESPSSASKSLLKYAPGTILDNLGCQMINGNEWCDVQKLGGGARGFVAKTYLKPAVSPDGSVAMGEDDSALRAGQGKYDATGVIPCAEHVGQPMGHCTFGVARAGGGYATVDITHASGRKCSIFFRLGKPIGSNMSEAEGYKKFTYTKEEDLYMIRNGNERYEIPEAVIFGG